MRHGDGHDTQSMGHVCRCVFGPFFLFVHPKCGVDTKCTQGQPRTRTWMVEQSRGDQVKGACLYSARADVTILSLSYVMLCENHASKLISAPLHGPRIKEQKTKGHPGQCPCASLPHNKANFSNLHHAAITITAQECFSCASSQPQPGQVVGLVTPAPLRWSSLPYTPVTVNPVGLSREITKSLARSVPEYAGERDTSKSPSSSELRLTKKTPLGAIVCNAIGLVSKVSTVCSMVR